VHEPICTLKYGFKIYKVKTNRNIHTHIQIPQCFAYTRARLADGVASANNITNTTALFLRASQFPLIYSDFLSIY